MADLPSQAPTPDIPPEFKSGTLRISMPRLAKPAPGGLMAKKIASAATTLPLNVPPSVEPKTPSAPTIPHAIVAPPAAKVYIEGDLFKDKAPSDDTEPLMPVPFNKTTPSATESGALPQLNTPRVTVFPLNGKGSPIHENGHGNGNGHTNGGTTKKAEAELSRDPQFPTLTISPAGRLTEPLPPAPATEKKDSAQLKLAPTEVIPTLPSLPNGSDIRPPVTGKLIKPQIPAADLKATATVPKVVPPAPDNMSSSSATLEKETLAKSISPPLQVTKAPFDPGINPTVLMNPPVTASATAPVPVLKPPTGLATTAPFPTIKPPKPDPEKAARTQIIPESALAKAPLAPAPATTTVKPEALTAVLPANGTKPAAPAPVAPAPEVKPALATPPVAPAPVVKPPAPAPVLPVAAGVKPLSPVKPASTGMTPIAPAAVKKSATMEIKGAPPKETARITVKPALPSVAVPKAAVAVAAVAAVAGATAAAVKPVGATKPSPGPTPLGSSAPRPKTSVVAAAVRPGALPSAAVKPGAAVPPSTSGAPAKTQAISSSTVNKPSPASPKTAATPVRAGAGSLPTAATTTSATPAASATSAKPLSKETKPAASRAQAQVSDDDAPSALVTAVMGVLALLIWGTAATLLASVYQYF